MLSLNVRNNNNDKLTGKRFKLKGYIKNKMNKWFFDKGKLSFQTCQNEVTENDRKKKTGGRETKTFPFHSSAESKSKTRN